jgi:hypothetical protein
MQWYTMNFKRSKYQKSFCLFTRYGFGIYVSLRYTQEESSSWIAPIQKYSDLSYHITLALLQT